MITRKMDMQYNESRIITAILKVVATAELYDPDATEETIRYCVEQDLEDVGFDVSVELLKEQEPIIRCKDCKYGLYTGTEYLCDRHSGHVNRFGEDQYYKEWHNGNWFCADGERQ